MSELINKEIINEQEKKLAFENYHRALQYVDSVGGEITHDVVCKIHSLCMDGLLSENTTGKYRTMNVGISRSSKTPPPWERVGDLMNRFLEDLNSRLNKCSRSLNDLPCLIETIAFAHYVFERIHPFEDGNGRVGRLLCDLIAKRFGIRPIIIWPPEREKYIETLEAINRSGNLAHLTLFLAKKFLERYPNSDLGRNRGIRGILQEIIKKQQEKIENQKNIGEETEIWGGFVDPCFG
jgi:cell filamentation protein